MVSKPWSTIGYRSQIPISILHHLLPSFLFCNISGFLTLLLCLVNIVYHAFIQKLETMQLYEILLLISLSFFLFFFSYKQSDSSVDESYSCPLLFEKLPEVNQEGSQWTDCETRDAINLIYQNLHKLDGYLSFLVSVFLYHYAFGRLFKILMQSLI